MYGQAAFSREIQCQIITLELKTVMLFCSKVKFEAEYFNFLLSSVYYARGNVAFSILHASFRVKSDSVAEEPFGRKEKRPRVVFFLFNYQCAEFYYCSEFQQFILNPN